MSGQSRVFCSIASTVQSRAVKVKRKKKMSEIIEQQEQGNPPPQEIAQATAYQTDEWSSRYGEVVWAKFLTYPWWPCCVVNPYRIPKTDDARRQAIKDINKNYTVYFYFDKTFAYVPPNKLKPYNSETIKEIQSQKTPKHYQKSIPEAMKEADQDAQREKNDRVNWYLIPVDEENVGYFSDSNQAEEEEAVGEETETVGEEGGEHIEKGATTKKKRGRPRLQPNKPAKKLKVQKEKKPVRTTDQVEEEELESDDLLDEAEIDDQNSEEYNSENENAEKGKKRKSGREEDLQTSSSEEEEEDEEREKESDSGRKPKKEKKIKVTDC
jgi:hypothetical protein